MSHEEALYRKKLIDDLIPMVTKGRNALADKIGAIPKDLRNDETGSKGTPPAVLATIDEIVKLAAAISERGLNDNTEGYAPCRYPESIRLNQKMDSLFKNVDEERTGYMYEMGRSSKPLSELFDVFQNHLLFQIKALQIAATSKNHSTALYPDNAPLANANVLHEQVFGGKLPFGLSY